MRRIFLSLPFTLFAFIAFTQSPAIKWTQYITKKSRPLPGNDDEFFFDLKRTSDLGFIAAGADSVSGISLSNALNRSVGARPWLVKLDSNGNKRWHVAPFNPNVDGTKCAFLSVQQTATQDYIAAGYAGDRRDSDPGKFYLTKIRSDGLFMWDRMYGGSGNERAYSIQDLGATGFAAAGFTTSNDGDVLDNHQAGTADAWLVQFDPSGNIGWKKCYGGTGNDTAFALVRTPDNGFLVVGNSTSHDGDLTGNAGGTDAWVFKTDNAGNLQWQKSFGGSGNDVFRNAILNADGTYTLVGTSSSTGFLGSINAGRNDVWAMKIDAVGQVIWSRLFGGSMDDQAFSIQTTPDGNYLVTGYTQSNDGHVRGNTGATDGWMLKLSPAGNFLWQKTFGTTRDEAVFGSVCLSENNIVTAGFGKPAGYNDNDCYLVMLSNSNTIRGQLFRDDNLNGSKDRDEVFFSQQATVTVQKQGYTQSVITNNGQFALDLDTGTFTTSVLANQVYYNVVPGYRTSSFPSYGNNDTLTFAVQPISNKKDLMVSILPLSPARPGFLATYQILYKNIGTTTIPGGTITFKKDSRTTLHFGMPMQPNISGDTLRWNYNAFGPGDTASIQIGLEISAPLVNVNDTLYHLASVDPVSGDLTPANNTTVFKHRVTGSFDPNDLSESNAGNVPASFIANGNYLQYTIRFQNTGTDAALNVGVRDTLSSRLDASSLQMVSASHPYSLTLENGNQLNWRFDNIYLVDSNANQSASHGYIVYRVKPKSDVVTGETIHNKASIYFDYNLPVATNDAPTTVQANPVVLPLNLLNFSGSYQNGRAVLQWTVAGTTTRSFEIERSIDGKQFQRVGSKAFEVLVNDYTFTDDVSAVSSRKLFYRIKIVETTGNFHYSDVLLLRVESEKDVSLEIYPNPATEATTVSFMSSEAGRLELQILNVSGSVLSRLQVSVLAGKNVYPLVDKKALRPGAYFVRLVKNNETTSASFMIQ